MTTLTYDQLRRIIALVHDNPILKAKLDEFLSGRLTSVSESDLLGIIAQSEVDKEMIRILSAQDPDTMDAFDALQVIADFFAYIRANKSRFSGWLANLGYQVQSTPTPKSSKPSK